MNTHDRAQYNFIQLLFYIYVSKNYGLMIMVECWLA